MASFTQQVHPLNFHYARHVHSKFAHFPEYALMNFCEDAVELDAIRSAYPHALMLHTKGYTRQSVGAREVKSNDTTCAGEGGCFLPYCCFLRLLNVSTCSGASLGGSNHATPSYGRGSSAICTILG